MLKRWVFNLLLKMGVENIDLMSYGRLYRILEHMEYSIV